MVLSQSLCPQHRWHVDVARNEGSTLTDIFISYSHQDGDFVTELRKRLQHQGWSVSLDLDLPGGARWAQAIEQHISAARVVIIVWSKAAIASHWVREEAQAALSLDKPLLPLTIDASQPPMGFRTIQSRAINRVTVDGEEASLEALLLDVRALLGDGDDAGASPRLEAHGAPSRSRFVPGSALELWVQIDSRPLLADNGKVWQAVYNPDMPIHQFLDQVYFELKPHVEPYSYNEQWILRDVTNGRLLNDIGEDALDRRKAALVGISSRSRYQIVAP